MKLKLSKSQWHNIGKVAGWLKKATDNAQKHVSFIGYDCNVVKKQYSNGRTALILVSAKDVPEKELFMGEIVATATVNIPEVNIGPDEVIIKNYSENKGIFDALIKANIIAETGRFAHSTMPIAKLLI